MIFSDRSRTVATLWSTALATLICAVLSLAGGAARAQVAADEWKVDPLRGPVDLGLTDPSLVGAIDVHLHVDPDVPGPAA